MRKRPLEFNRLALKTMLAQTLHHIELTNTHLAKQRERVLKAKNSGRDSTEETRLLDQFEEHLRQQRHRYNELKGQLSDLPLEGDSD